MLKREACIEQTLRMDFSVKKENFYNNCRIIDLGLIPLF